ncbi:FkbM family methyltransferase [Nodosilinea sp. AN01ver1]|uniref:FkbM family methyltransferase n=1 Tax=Nodosilinea sp. AN01ver1 TaxID=3423362 RepID=UPI003D323EBB
MIQVKKIKDGFKKISRKRIASPFEVEKAEQIFYISYLKKGMTVFDVGANIGELSLLFSRFVGTSGKVHAFEASSNTFQRLLGICKHANRSQIQINHCAVADVEAIMSLNVYDEQHSGWSSLANRQLEQYGINVTPVFCEEVSSITLDNYCKFNDIKHIDLLKIDVEGAEYQVMLGAKELFQNQQVKCCVFEFGATTFDMENTPQEIESFLTSCNYKITNVVPGNPVFPGKKSAKNAQFSIHIARPLA